MIENTFLEVNMFKKILLVILSILLILGCCACNNTPKETEAETDDGTPTDKIVLSGDTRYRIVYAKDADPAPAKKYTTVLKRLTKTLSRMTITFLPPTRHPQITLPRYS